MHESSDVKIELFSLRFFLFAPHKIFIHKKPAMSRIIHLLFLLISYCSEFWRNHIEMGLKCSECYWDLLWNELAIHVAELQNICIAAFFFIWIEWLLNCPHSRVENWRKKKLYCLFVSFILLDSIFSLFVFFSLSPSLLHFCLKIDELYLIRGEKHVQTMQSVHIMIINCLST